MFTLCFFTILLFHETFSFCYRCRCSPQRTTRYGKICGQITSRVPGKDVEEYLGVPYAAPPVGKLRFKRPQTPRKWWPETLETKSLPPACPTYNLDYIQFHKKGFNATDEDCLYMNIYVPKTAKGKGSLPVLFYIHGGSNADGMGAMFDGDILAAHGQIIVVTFNYRLTVLGFYANPSIGIDGNNGLLDQVMAMQWVQDNIHHFGGDRRRVTIHGQSFGAADVGFHLVSDTTKGLFQHAIINSGSPIATWATSKCVQSSRTLIKPDTCRKGTSLVSEHVQQAVDNVVNGTSNMTQFFASINYGQDDVFPVVEDGLYLSESPEKLFTCGQFHVDSVLVMLTEDEGLQPNVSKIEETYGEQTVKLFTKFNQHFFPEKIKTFSEDVQQTSKDWIEKNIIRYPAVMHLFAGLDFFTPSVKLADYISKWNEDVYLLSFEYTPERITTPKWIGVQHGWDLFFIFGVPLVGHHAFSFTDEDIRVSKQTMDMISNFVKSGNLIFDGKKKDRYSRIDRTYNKLDISNGKQVLTKESGYKSPMIDFWNKYLFAYPDTFQCQQTPCMKGKFNNMNSKPKIIAVG